MICVTNDDAPSDIRNPDWEVLATSPANNLVIIYIVHRRFGGTQSDLVASVFLLVTFFA